MSAQHTGCERDEAIFRMVLLDQCRAYPVCGIRGIRMRHSEAYHPGSWCQALVQQGEASASWLAGHVPFTRQAVSKHLVVLEEAGLVALEDAGAFSIVLESIPAPVATMVTERLSIPTIGIGAGAGVQGGRWQVRTAAPRTTLVRSCNPRTRQPRTHGV